MSSSANVSVQSIDNLTEVLKMLQPPSTWKLEKGSDEFQHPHLNFLFLGVDENGDYIPTRALREKYSQARTDVQPPEVQ